MDMDTSSDRLVVKIRLHRRDDHGLGPIDAMAVTTIRHLSERKLASRDCSLRRAVLIQKALPFLDVSALAAAPLSPPSPAYIAAEDNPWDRDPPGYETTSPSSHHIATDCNGSGAGIMLPSLEDDMDPCAFGASAEGPLLFHHGNEERDHDWFDQEGASDFAEPVVASALALAASSLTASLEDDDETSAHGVVTASEQPEISLASCAESDEEEEEEAVRELFRKFSGSASAARARKQQQQQKQSALGKRSRYGMDAEDEDEIEVSAMSGCEDDLELSQYTSLAQAEPLKCLKPSHSASPCGMTRRASSSSSSPSSSCAVAFPVLSLV